MSYVFALMIAVGIAYGAINGNIAAVMDALTEGACQAVTLCISLAGAYMLWLGLMRRNITRHASAAPSHQGSAFFVNAAFQPVGLSIILSIVCI